MGLRECHVSRDHSAAQCTVMVCSAAFDDRDLSLAFLERVERAGCIDGRSVEQLIAPNLGTYLYLSSELGIPY
jgi:hypothetical protein